MKPPSPGELDDMAAALGGHEKLLDPASPAAQERGIVHLDCDYREELLKDPGLYRTPLVRAGRGTAAAGLDEGMWTAFSRGAG